MATATAVEQTSDVTSIDDVIRELQRRRREAQNEKNVNKRSAAREAYADAIFLLLELPE